MVPSSLGRIEAVNRDQAPYANGDSRRKGNLKVPHHILLILSISRSKESHRLLSSVAFILRTLISLTIPVVYIDRQHAFKSNIKEI